MSILLGILYFLFFAVLVPCELLWWGSSLDGILAGSFLAKRLLLNPLTEVPSGVFLVTGAISLGCMIRAIVELSRRSHAADPLLFGAFPFYMMSLFLYFHLPCALCLTMPLIVLGEAAVWSAYRPEGRPAFQLPRTPDVRLGSHSRLAALVLLTGLLIVAGLFLQDRYLYCLYASTWVPVLIFLPLLAFFLVVFGAAVWWVFRPGDRSAFQPPRTRVLAGLRSRLAALVLLTGLLIGAGLCLQDGYLYWLYVSPWTPVLIFLPLLGVLLPTSGQLREYLGNSVYALVLCCLINGVGLMLIDDSWSLMDYEVVVAYIFLGLELSLIVRPLLRRVPNGSLLILGMSSILNSLIVPQLCSPWIITFSCYILYLMIDNRRTVRAAILVLARKLPKPRFSIGREAVALSWGCSALLAVYLTGPDYRYQILAGICAVFFGAMLRVHFLNNTRSDHIVLRNFPYALEIFSLLLTAIACSRFRLLDGLLIPDGEARVRLMIVLCSFAAAAGLLQTIWYGGGLFGKYTDRPASDSLMLSIGNAGICFFVVLLFFMRAPASILLGYFLILSGIVRIQAAASRKLNWNLSLTTGWILIAVGQFILVSSSTAKLPVPKWTPVAAITGVAAFVAFYITWIFELYCRKKKEKSR